MAVVGLTPILNVSSIAASMAWFEGIGWEKKWDWGKPPTFGCVANGKVQIFFCVGAQGSLGGTVPRHGEQAYTGGVWMSWWVESKAEVDAIYALAVRLGYLASMPPRDEPWGVREFHLVHPDGHTFRVSAENDCG